MFIQKYGILLIKLLARGCQTVVCLLWWHTRVAAIQRSGTLPLLLTLFETSLQGLL